MNILYVKGNLILTCLICICNIFSVVDIFLLLGKDFVLVISRRVGK